MKSVYISGPMSGYPNLNFPAFYKAADLLDHSGWDVVNPADINPDPNADWFDCIIVDMKLVKNCDAIYMLKGWEQSPGAQIEYWTAIKYKKEILYEQEYD